VQRAAISHEKELEDVQLVEQENFGKVDLSLLHVSGQVDGFVGGLDFGRAVAGLMKDAINSRARARQTIGGLLLLAVLIEGMEDGEGAGTSVELFGQLLAQIDDELDGLGIEGVRGVMGGARAAGKIVEGRVVEVSEALAPLGDLLGIASDGFGQSFITPVRILTC